MGSCATTPPEEHIQPQTNTIEKPKPKITVDYYSQYPWSKNVLGIIAYWNRNSNTNFVELNKDVESMIQRFCLNDLILKEWSYVTFKSNQTYEFTNIIVKKRAVLTVEKYNKNTNPNGGKLLLHCYGDFIVENGAVIDLKGRGYNGGQRWWSGLSYQGESLYKEQECNYGGGGCTKLYSALWFLSSGGAGYATKGEDGLCETFNGKQYHFEGLGGQTYGDKELKVLHLGSGGGGSRFCAGGHGGGALKIICNKFINRGSIQCNGDRGGGATKNGGGGSGGSCLIVVHGNQFDNKEGIIDCRGAQSIHQVGRGGAGGDGRVCIKFVRNQMRLQSDFVVGSAEKLFDENGKIIDKNGTSGYVRKEFGDIDPKAYIMILGDQPSVISVKEEHNDDGEFLYSRQGSILDDLVADNVKSLDDDDDIDFIGKEPSAAHILDYRCEQKVDDVGLDDLLSEPGEDLGIGNEGEIKYPQLLQWFNEIEAFNEEEVRRYYQLFVKNGFNDLFVIKYMNETDLKGMGIDVEQHRKNIMIAMENLSKYHD